MRKYCLDCTIKHLGQAYVLTNEVEQGYTEHILGVIGHLTEASEECFGASVSLSNKIRQYRLLIHENILDVIDGKYRIQIPYFDLFNQVIELMKEIGCGDCKKTSESFKEKIKLAKQEKQHIEKK